MKKLCVLIANVIMVLFLLSNITVSASMPPSLHFDTIDEIRSLVLSFHDSSKLAEYYKNNRKVVGMDVTKPVLTVMVEERIMYAPFICLRDGIEYENFESVIRYDGNIDHWEIKYNIDGVKYYFLYYFNTELLLDISDATFKKGTLSDFNIALKQNEKFKDSYEGSLVVSEGVSLSIDVQCENIDKIDFSIFNLGELSLELDSDRTTEATTAVTTETPSSATTPKEEPNNSTGKTAFVIIGSVIIIAVLSVLTIVIMRRRRE